MEESPKKMRFWLRTEEYVGVSQTTTWKSHPVGREQLTAYSLKREHADSAASPGEEEKKCSWDNTGLFLRGWLKEEQKIFEF